MTPAIFVLGFGPGLSSAIASRFASGGFSIGVVSRKADAAAFGSSKVVSTAGDGLDPASLVAALDKLTFELGNPSVVIYNIARLGTKSIAEVTTQDMLDHYTLGPVSGLVVGQWCEKNLVGKKKSLLFTGGGLSKMVRPPFAALGSSKAALLHLANNLNDYLRPSGIHVATVTICGVIREEDPKHNPKAIAELYWQAHHGGVGGDAEIVY